MITGGNGSNHISDSPEAIRLCEEGTRDLNAFRWHSAIKKLGQSLELDPTLAEASISRAFAYVRLGQRSEFLEEVAHADSLTAMIEDDQRRMLAQLRVSGIGKSKFYGIRDSVLNRLDVEIPENIFVLEAKAHKAGMTGDPEKEEQAWLRVLDVDPNYASSYNNLGYMELNRGNYDKAIEYMQKYAFLAPDLANPHDSLGEVLMVMGRYEEAEAEFRRSIEMQPTFYHSLINLGKTYIARGQLKTGVDIMEKVHLQVASSEIQRWVDYEILSTYLHEGLNEQLAKMSLIYIDRYPEDDSSAIYRGMNLAYAGQVDAGRAIMDSTLASWREGMEYKSHPNSKKGIDGAAFQFTALLADVVEDHDLAAESWAQAVPIIEKTKSLHAAWYARGRWAASLHAGGHSAKSVEILNPIIQVNPRIISMLVLKVECHLALRQGDLARQAFEQLQWSLGKSDKDFPTRLKAEELRLKVDALAIGG